MKSRLSIIVLLLSVLCLYSCDESFDRVVVKEGSNEMNELSSSSYVLTREEASEEFDTFSWTAPDFGFQASIAYTVQVDLADGDFSNAVDIASIGNALEIAVSVGDVNKKLNDLGLTPKEASEVKFRVVSVISGNLEPVYSNAQTATVTPYEITFPSIYGMGEALNGWGPWPTAAVEVAGIAPNKYETFVKLTTDKAFRFFAQQDWGPVSYNYPYFSSVDANFVNAADGDQNFKFVGTTGWYKVTVDLSAKTVTLAAAAEPLLYMVGAAINGWNWDPGTPVKMTFKKPGVFEATTDFANDTFRFFAQADWGPTSYNYPFFSAVDSKFENANDGDKNLRFIGTAGEYKITVDLNKKTVTMQ